MIRDSLQSRSPFKLEFRITVKDGIRHIRGLLEELVRFYVQAQDAAHMEELRQNDDDGGAGK